MRKNGDERYDEIVYQAACNCDHECNWQTRIITEDKPTVAQKTL